MDENGLITSKKAINTIAYYYDGNGTLRQKKVIPYETRYIFPRSVSYEYPENGDPVVSFDSGDYYVTSHSKHDSFGRKIFDELQLQCGTLSRQYTYCKGKATDLHIEEDKMKSRPATRLIKTVTFDDERTLTYSYDAEDRITKIVDSEGGITEYAYDELGQLLTETADGAAVNSMTYDNYGNIKTKNGVSYTYDSVCKDLLTKVGSQTITYDKQGNPTDYLGHTLVWEKGRQLKSFDTNSYTYNANGIRTSKTVNGVKHSYVIDGTKILREVYGSNVIAPIYDNEDSICGIYNRTKPYYFIKNLQGDVIGITDERGGLIAEYKYDAWGVPTVVKHAASAAIADLNPFRYRGYYYDTETGLYYLQSRYYDPNTGRFINADEMMDSSMLLGLNIFTYCENCPIIYIDTTGYGKVYSIYYNNPGSGFEDQAKNSSYYNSKNVTFKAVISIRDFKNAWNSMYGDIDYVFLYLHGGTGVLYFKQETMNMNQIKALNSKKVKYRVHLFSCHGGDGKEGQNVAWAFAKLTNSKVVACTGSVSYSKIFGKYFARKANDWGYFRTFYYQKRYIWWGPIVAKSYMGSL